MQEIKPKRIRSRRWFAERANCCTRTLARLEAKGLLPPRVQISDRLFGYEESDIEAWIAARRSNVRAA
jgi:hypothetical protein